MPFMEKKGNASLARTPRKRERCGQAPTITDVNMSHTYYLVFFDTGRLWRHTDATDKRNIEPRKHEGHEKGQ